MLVGEKIPTDTKKYRGVQRGRFCRHASRPLNFLFLFCIFLFVLNIQIQTQKYGKNNDFLLKKLATIEIFCNK